MCTSTEEKFSSPKRRQRPDKPKVQVIGLLNRKRLEDKYGNDMKLKNLKLYLENKSIVQENEKLRKQANILYQENLALMSGLQKRFPDFYRFCTTNNIFLQST